jgi:hypothetical protein
MPSPRPPHRLRGLQPAFMSFSARSESGTVGGDQKVRWPHADHGGGPVEVKGALRMSKPIKLDKKLQDWVDARKRHRLSHAHVQMARELGMNPRKLGKIDNHDQEPWKAPLPQFIEALYEKRFGRRMPAEVISIEEKARRQRKKKMERAAERARRKSQQT